MSGGENGGHDGMLHALGLCSARFGGRAHDGQMMNDDGVAWGSFLGLDSQGSLDLLRYSFDFDTFSRPKRSPSFLLTTMPPRQ